LRAVPGIAARVLFSASEIKCVVPAIFARREDIPMRRIALVSLSVVALMASAVTVRAGHGSCCGSGGCTTAGCGTDCGYPKDVPVTDPCTGCTRIEHQQQTVVQKARVIQIEVVPPKEDCLTKTEVKTRNCIKIYIDHAPAAVCAPAPACIP
jgi:hypothetical protein